MSIFGPVTPAALDALTVDERKLLDTCPAFRLLDCCRRGCLKLDRAYWPRRVEVRERGDSVVAWYRCEQGHEWRTGWGGFFAEPMIRALSEEVA